MLLIWLSYCKFQNGICFEQLLGTEERKKESNRNPCSFGFDQAMSDQVIWSHQSPLVVDLIELWFHDSNQLDWFFGIEGKDCCSTVKKQSIETQFTPIGLNVPNKEEEFAIPLELHLNCLIILHHSYGSVNCNPLPWQQMHWIKHWCHELWNCTLQEEQLWKAEQLTPTISCWSAFWSSADWYPPSCFSTGGKKVLGPIVS